MSETDTNTELVVYVDMDGVLVQYERSAYTGKDPQYIRPGFHYFRKLKPDHKMIAVLKALNEKPNVTVRILTTVSHIGSMFLEQANDKIEWLNEFADFIDTDTQFIATSSNKRALAESISSNCNKSIFPNFGINHILIDDYNKNLEDWSTAGGTGIKYINGLNNPDSYNGLVLDLTMSSEDIVELITNHINYLAREHNSN